MGEGLAQIQAWACSALHPSVPGDKLLDFTRYGNAGLFSVKTGWKKLVIFSTTALRIFGGMSSGKMDCTDTRADNNPLRLKSLTGVGYLQQQPFTA